MLIPKFQSLSPQCVAHNSQRFPNRWAAFLRTCYHSKNTRLHVRTQVIPLPEPESVAYQMSIMDSLSLSHHFVQSHPSGESGGAMDGHVPGANPVSHCDPLNRRKLRISSRKFWLIVIWSVNSSVEPLNSTLMAIRWRNRRTEPQTRPSLRQRL